MLEEVDGVCRTAEIASKLTPDPLEILCGGHVCHFILSGGHVQCGAYYNNFASHLWFTTFSANNDSK